MTYAADSKSETNAFLKWCYRMGLRVDRLVLNGIDTSYISLPDHSWRLAYTNAMVGIRSTYTEENWYIAGMHLGNISLHQRTTPSINLGFHAGYRGLGFGYSWDAMHAYSQNWNISLGSKSIGVEFKRQRSSNISGDVSIKDVSMSYKDIEENEGRSLKNSIVTTSLDVWYALNAAHYSHNAAVKQSYIQRKSAGSLLLQFNYKSIEVNLDSTLRHVTNNVIGVETHQVGVGLGYGINYTPNHGKVLLHFSGIAQLVCFSHNLLTHVDTMNVHLAGMDTSIVYDGLYRVASRYPVHVAGTMRAAVSYEINEWVHLTTWAQVSNARFMAQAEEASVRLSNWNWQVNLHVGVRLGVGKKRVVQALGQEEYDLLTKLPEPSDRVAKLPRWLTDWFFSPRL